MKTPHILGSALLAFALSHSGASWAVEPADQTTGSQYPHTLGPGECRGTAKGFCTCRIGAGFWTSRIVAEFRTCGILGVRIRTDRRAPRGSPLFIRVFLRVPRSATAGSRPCWTAPLPAAGSRGSARAPAWKTVPHVRNIRCDHDHPGVPDTGGTDPGGTDPEGTGLRRSCRPRPCAANALAFFPLVCKRVARAV